MIWRMMRRRSRKRMWRKKIGKDEGKIKGKEVMKDFGGIEELKSKDR